MRILLVVGSMFLFGLLAPYRGASGVNAVSFGSMTSTFRVRTGAAGMYRLTYADLIAAGVPDGAATAGISMSYLGEPVGVEVRDRDGKLSAGDLVIFYAEDYRGRYMTDNVYFLSYGGVPLARMEERPSAPPRGQPQRDWTYVTAHVEFDEQYFSDYPLPKSSDHMFDSPTLQATASVPVTTVSYDLPLQHPLAAGEVRFRGQFYGGKAQDANPDQSVSVKLNAHDLGTFAWDGRTGNLATAAAPAAYLDATQNRLTVEAARTQLSALADYWAYVDWLEVDYPSALIADGDRLSAPDLDLGDETGVEVVASGFTTSTVTVYDTRNSRRPVIIVRAQATDLGGRYEIRFRDAWAESEAPPRYYLSTEAALLAPRAIEPAAAPPWNAPDNHYDYIAIVHRSLWDAIDPLLAHRAAGGLRVAKVDPQDIYDIYSSGRLDPEAIRDFLSYAYLNWNGGGTRPRYVLLVGDGHYDFKNALGTPLKNLVPPYLLDIDPWIGETAADNRYVAVASPDDNVPNMAIGRIPAQSADEVRYAVDKILAYEDPRQAQEGPWQNRASFIADEPDNGAGNFQVLSEEARLNWLPDSYDSRTIYWETDYYTADAMQAAIKSAFTDSILVQWFGHASRFRWASITGIFNVYSVPDIPATNRWPVSIDYSCWTGYFINLNKAVLNGMADYHSLAEKLLLTPGKGSVAVIGPSGQHVGDALQVLNRGFVRAIFQEEIQPLGDAFNAAKEYYQANSSGWPDVIDTTLLFGDPATRLGIAPRARPPVISIERSPELECIKLLWTNLEVNRSYEIWRGESPYFEPGRESQQVGTAHGATPEPGVTVAFTDDGSGEPVATVVGDPARNYFWIVRGVNATGPSDNSNRVGEFDFALAPGFDP